MRHSGLGALFAAISRSIARKLVTALSRLRWQRDPVQGESVSNLHYRYSHDIGNVLVLRCFGVWAKDGRVRWRLGPMLASLAVIASPLLLAASLACFQPVPPQLNVSYFGWLLYFMMLSIVVPLFAWGGVAVFHGLTPALAKSLTASGRAAYDEWADVSTATLPQALFGALVSVAAVVALWLVSLGSGISEILHITTASYLSVAVTGFFVAGGGYWIGAGTILSWPLTREGNMQASWYAPVATPGIELLSRCYRLGFYGASVGVGLCLFPILSWAYAVPQNWLIGLLKAALFLLCLLSVLGIAILPQWRLTRLVAEQRRQAFIAIVDQLADSPGALAPEHLDARSAYLLGWLQTLVSSRPSTISESAAVGILLGAATALLPYFIQLWAGST